MKFEIKYCLFAFIWTGENRKDALQILKRKQVHLNFSAIQCDIDLVM